MSNVTKELCDEKHNSVDYKIDSISSNVRCNSERIKSVEEAVIILTNMVEVISKRSIFDKILILTVFIIAVVLCAVVLGPELTSALIGGVG